MMTEKTAARALNMSRQSDCNQAEGKTINYKNARGAEFTGYVEEVAANMVKIGGVWHRASSMYGVTITEDGGDE